MKFKQLLLVFGILFLYSHCKEVKKEEVLPDVVEKEIMLEDSIKIIMKMPKVEIPSLADLSDTLFIRLADYSADFQYDMRYATENNFLKAKVYDCAECYTRVKTAKALIAANSDFMKEGYRIKFFDCYRPNDVQYKMWEIVPNPQYVADPVKGSIHNKGGAVDITLVDMDGAELDMGTDFDFFGRKAYHDNMDLPEEVLENRKLLKETMEKHGFWSIRTEWWHYNLSTASNDPVANFTWPCPTTIN
ncbi:MAG: M15 family metallopeptidase [Bacteroidia bacterium]|nr:M15 family metallopeptidase [Bacteroidia bacterium]